MSFKIWPGDVANGHRAAEFSAIGIGVSKVTTPVPPNGGLFYTHCPSAKLTNTFFDMADPTAYSTAGATFDRYTFHVEGTDWDGILLAQFPFVTIYLNRDAVTGNTNFELRVYSEVGPGYTSILKILDSNGLILGTVKNPFDNNVPYQVDCAFAISNSGWLNVFINRQDVYFDNQLAIKADTSPLMFHTHRGHQNIDVIPPVTTTYYWGHMEEIDSGLTARPQTSFARFRSLYTGVTPPARCNHLGSVTTPGDDLTTGVSEYISDDLGAANNCGYTPPQFVPLGGVWPNDLSPDWGPKQFFLGGAIVPACKFMWWYDMKIGASIDPWLTWGHVNQSGTYTMTAANVPLGRNAKHAVYLEPGDTYFPPIASSYAAAGLFHKASDSSPKVFTLDQIWVFFAYDTGSNVSTERAVFPGPQLRQSRLTIAGGH